MKKRNKIILFSVLGLTALALLLKPKKTAAQPSDSGTGGGGNVSSGGSGTTSGLDFRSLANQLFDAMDGYGTSNAVIKDIFKQIKTDADYDALKSAYGVREKSSGFGNIFVSNFEGDLPASLKDEMSKSEIAELNQILTSNRISRVI